ncbi:hypothetical protein MKW98_005964 [Papaver atlanticum]|uniref:Threonyl/alanyl tRNA synthetase SAD domain-containing protein n=1 Tax=Papaver atlanticum TaxID=357466 RepID=A0AAD4S6V7_9MAGN|nr:hypothetical protein MKW98_005964 [Papaver atlanticum]
MKDQLRKRMFKKRRIKRITLSIAGGISIEVNTYALIRPTVPGATTWLYSVTNKPLKLQTERSFICADTGALVEEPSKRFQPYKSENIKFSTDELAEIKRVSTGHLRLLGFKPLSCLKDYHNLRPSTFLFPSDELTVLMLNLNCSCEWWWLHSAGHLLDTCMQNVGLGNLEPTKGYHFSDGPFELELEANALISKEGKVFVAVLPYEEASELCGGSLPDYISKSTPGVVKMGNSPGCPCGGTHVSDIREIKNLKVTQIRVKKGCTKVFYTIET